MMMNEIVFFEYEDVKVTNSRFISGSQTYAMGNVTSVKAFEKKPNRLGGILALLIGLLFSVSAPYVGLTILVVAAIYLYKQKTIYHVMLSTSGGETSALKTYQREYLDKVVSALNKAIVHRG
ncbi:MAG: DUF6232 family protein [Gallionella sp.]|nr:DUF6232 family protein [Gallionella sp.]